MKICFPEEGNTLDFENILDFEHLRNKIKDIGYNTSGKTYLWKFFQIEQLQNHFETISVVQESILSEKILVINDLATNLKFDRNATIENLIFFILNSGLTDSKEIFTIICGNRELEFVADKYLKLIDIPSNILWIKTDYQSEYLCQSFIPQDEPLISRGDLLNSLEVLRNRLVTLNNSPLVSKTKLYESDYKRRLQLHPISKIKFILPTKIIVTIEIESSKQIQDLIFLILQRLKIEYHLIDFILPPNKISEGDQVKVIAMTELYPKSTVMVKEKS
jgi:hypothetical protein